MFRFLCACALPISLVNCGGSRHTPDEKYFLVAANIKVPYWQSAGNGLMAAARQFKVQAEVVGPDNYDPPAERQEFQKLLALPKKPAGILVSPADPELMKADIDAAIAAGIPVITMDSDSPSSKRLTFIGTNNYEAGVMGGRIAAKLLDGKGAVVVFTMPGQTNLSERLHGYRDAFAQYPRIKIAEVVDIKGDPRIAFDTTTAIVEKRRNTVDGFVCLEALAGKEVAEVLARNQVKGKAVVAMDADEGTLNWIDKGVIAATIAQKPFTMAYYGARMLDDLHHDKPPSLDINTSQDPFSRLPAFVDTGATVIDKDNVNAFMKARESSKSR